MNEFQFAYLNTLCRHFKNMKLKKGDILLDTYEILETLGKGS